MALSPKSPDSQHLGTSEIQTGQLFILLISVKSWGEGGLQDLQDSALGASASRVPQQDPGHAVAGGYSTESCDEAVFSLLTANSFTALSCILISFFSPMVDLV